VFAELHLAYRAPAYFGEEIRTSVRPSHLERSSFRADVRMAVAERLIAEGHGVYVGYDYAAERAQRWPSGSSSGSRRCCRDRLTGVL